MPVPHPADRLRRLASALTMCLAGCAVGPNFVPPSPQTPAQWSQSQQRESEHERADLSRWWSDFNDPGLNSLIQRAVDANLDLRVAVLRIDEARAQRGVTAAAFWPNLGLNASYTRTRLSETTPTGALFNSIGDIKIPGVAGFSIPNPYNQYQLGADVSWELDLFGRVSRYRSRISARRSCPCWRMWLGITSSFAARN
jgi:outer membrane protein TolC